MKKYFKYFCLVTVGVTLAHFCFSAGGAHGAGTNQSLTSRGKEYNILLITLDTLRRDRLSVYSDKYVKTPNIDSLAEKSFVFSRAFSHNPVTLPAHINILTGTTPRYHGISDNIGFRLAKRFLTIAEYLKEKGYAAGAFIGAFPLDSRFGLDQGFDVYDDNYGTRGSLQMLFVERPAEKVIEPAVRWISRQQGKWFAWVHLFDPHQPYAPPYPFSKQYSHDPYSGEVAYMDASLEKLFTSLAGTETVVILTSDHGEALGEKGEENHAYFAYNNTIHVPLIIHIPGTETRVKKIAENVSHIDIFPTICALLDMEIPAHIQGQSLTPLMEKNNGKREKNSIYFESLTPYLNSGWAPLRGFIRENIKFIDLPIPEVYHIKNDGGENHNLAANSNIKQLKRDLVKLKLELKGKDMMRRSRKIAASVRDKLKGLGYLSGSTPSTAKVFTAEHDLKRQLPLHNRMLAAMTTYMEGKAQESLAQLQGILKENPKFIVVYRHIATIFMESGQAAKAVEILESGLEKNPGSTELMSKLGIMLVEAGRAGQAIEMLKLCIKKEGVNVNPENFNFLGVAYYKTGDFSSALENYRKALELDHNYAPVFNNIGSLYLVVYLKRKDEKAYRLALQNFGRALEIDPRLFAAYNGRGAAYKFKNEIEKAIADWKKAVEINPDLIDSYFNIGIAYLEKGDKATALNYFLLCKEKFNTKLPPGEQQRLARLINEARR